MPFERHKLSNGVVRTHVTGEMDAAVSTRSLSELSGFVTDDLLFEVVTHADEACISVSFQEGRQLAQAARAFYATLQGGRIAFVAGGSLTYGRLRQLTLALGTTAVEVHVFREEQSAVSWMEKGLAHPRPENGL